MLMAPGWRERAAGWGCGDERWFGWSVGALGARSTFRLFWRRDRSRRAGSLKGGGEGRGYRPGKPGSWLCRFRDGRGVHDGEGGDGGAEMIEIPVLCVVVDDPALLQAFVRLPEGRDEGGKRALERRTLLDKRTVDIWHVTKINAFEIWIGARQKVGIH